MRTLAIGDIHGCLSALKALLRHVEPDASDTIITLGDYVDRGPDSKGVIDLLLDLRRSNDVICLRGNHEIMMLEARNNRSHALLWLHHGGNATLASYDADNFERIPNRHWEFIASTVPYHQTETCIFVHANVLPDTPLDEQPEDVLFWQHLPRWQLRKRPHHQSGKTVICGHTSQQSGEILDRESIICIDTFAHGGKWLTCLDAESLQWWQANESGEVRSGRLSTRST